MIHNRIESKYRDLFLRYKMETIISPLEIGILTRKYIDDLPEDYRYWNIILIIIIIFNFILKINFGWKIKTIKINWLKEI